MKFSTIPLYSTAKVEGLKEFLGAGFDLSRFEVGKPIQFRIASRAPGEDFTPWYYGILQAANLEEITVAFLEPDDDAAPLGRSSLTLVGITAREIHEGVAQVNGKLCAGVRVYAKIDEPRPEPLPGYVELSDDEQKLSEIEEAKSDEA